MTKLIEKFSTLLVENGKLHYTLFFVLLLALTAFGEYINSPLIYGHDTLVHYTRIHGLMQAMQDGRFPWYIDYNDLNNYGYFLKAFYCDVLLIPFAIVGLFTDTLFAYHVIIVCTTIATGMTAFWAVRRVFRCSKMAAIAALLYTFCNYRILDVYMRGAMGEVFTFIVLPILFVGAYEIISGNYKKWYILTIGFSLLIFSHLLSTALTAIVFAIVLLFYAKRFVKEPARFRYLAIATVATVAITACYLFPMFEQMLSNTFSYQVSATTAPMGVKYNALSIRQLVKGLIEVIPNANLSFAPRMGLILTLGILLRVFVAEKTAMLKQIDKLAIVGLVFVVLTSALIPWNKFPFSTISVIQFPWRLFLYASFCFAIAGAYYASCLLKQNSRYIPFLIGLAAFCYIPIQAESVRPNYNANPELPHIGKQDYKNIVMDMIPEARRFSYGLNEYIPAAIDKTQMRIVKYGERKATHQDSTTAVTNYQLEKGIITFDINQPDKVEIPQTYYLGYAAYINDKSVNLSQSDKGLISLDVKEAGRVEVYYKATKIQIISTIVSCLAILAMCAYILRIRRKKKTNIDK